MRSEPMTYSAQIAAVIETQRLNQTMAGPIFTPRHIEAYMRCEHGTLDALSLPAFEDAIVDACECIAVGGVPAAEQLAVAMGIVS